MSLPFQPWRAALQPASYGGASFHVEVGSQAGGRRGPTHEFAKEDIPFTEDMGRRARRWPTTAYNIGPDYLDYRDALLAALEAGGSQLLVHPTLGEIMANVDTYTMTETRERGGWCTFEILFVESGSLDNGGISADTQGQAVAAANSLGSAAAAAGNRAIAP